MGWMHTQNILSLPLPTSFPVPVQLTKIRYHSNDGLALYERGGEGRGDTFGKHRREREAGKIARWKGRGKEEG